MLEGFSFQFFVQSSLWVQENLKDYQSIILSVRWSVKTLNLLYFDSVQHVLLESLKSTFVVPPKSLSFHFILRLNLSQACTLIDWLIDVDNAWENKFKDGRLNRVLLAIRITRLRSSFLLLSRNACKLSLINKSGELSVRKY